MILPYRPMGELAGGGRGHRRRDLWRSWDRFSFSEVRTSPLLGRPSRRSFGGGRGQGRRTLRRSVVAPGSMVLLLPLLGGGGKVFASGEFGLERVLPKRLAARRRAPPPTPPAPPAPPAPPTPPAAQPLQAPPSPSSPSMEVGIYVYWISPIPKV